MKRFWPILLAVVFLASTGCTRGVPVAVVPEDRVDFGDVPVVMDMSKAVVKTFAIRNEGTAPLRVGDVQVKVLEGC